MRQPREAVGEPALLELPAGKLDERGEEPLETAKRELAEEIGKGAREWRALTRFYTSPGFAEEECHLFLATDLYDEHAEADEDERIEIVRCRSTELDDDDRAAAATRRRSSACSGCVPSSCADARVAAQGSAPGRPNPSGGMATIEQPLQSRRFEHLVLDFLAYLEFERGLSRNTLEAYRSDLLQFGRFLERRGLTAATPRRPTSPTSWRSSRRDGRVRRSPPRSRSRPPCARRSRPSPRRRRRCTARPPACAPSTATCAARACATPTRRPPSARRAAAASCRRCSRAARSRSCSPSRAAPSRRRCATARCSS